MTQINQIVVVLLVFSNVFVNVHCASPGTDDDLIEIENIVTPPYDKVAVECDCGPYGDCEFDGYNKKCKCAPLSVEIDGKCVECNCGKLSKSCSYSADGKKVCKCQSGYVQADGKCTKCDCGINGLCKIESGQKKCICSPSYVEVNGKCLACECGKATDACVLDSAGDKKCSCRAGYKLNDGTCEECYCGRYGTCSFENGLKKCLCQLYYSPRNGTCELCSCGKNYRSCYFDSNFDKVCECYSKFALKDGFCEECDCGYYGSCSFENGRKRCKCNPPTVEMYGRCVFTTMPPSTTRKPTTILTSTTEGCFCGNNSIACHRDTRGENVCDCFWGYLQNNGQCEECNCGPHGGCTFQNGTKKCICRPYTTEVNGVCVDFGTTSVSTTDSNDTSTIVYSTVQECDCGSRGRCVFEYGEKKCICDSFAAEKDGMCVDCYCGKNSKGCAFNFNGHKVCSCKSGYSQVSGFCFECNCGLNARSCSYNKDETKVCSCDVGYTQVNGRCSAICKEDKCIHGKCEVVANGFKCRCHEGFTGERCEEKIAIKPSRQDIWMILILFVTSAIFIILSAMFCCWTRFLSKVSSKK